jgi:hypothetical protein
MGRDPHAAVFACSSTMMAGSEDTNMNARKPEIRAYDYRGSLVVVMPSGLSLVMQPSASADSARRIVHEASSLENARIWIDDPLA